MWIISKSPTPPYIKGVIICSTLNTSLENSINEKNIYIEKMSQTIHYPWIFSEVLIDAFEVPAPKD